MGIQTKFDLYVSELNDKISDLLEEEINKDLIIVNDILDISQPYQDELGLTFTMRLYYEVSGAPIKFLNGTYVYDENHKFGFSDVKKLTRSIDRGWAQINIDLDHVKAKWGPEFQRQTDRLSNNILKFYPNFETHIRKYILTISYNRNNI